MSPDKYHYKNIPVKGHYRTYRIGSYPGPYEDVKKWIPKGTRRIKKLNYIPQSFALKSRFYNTKTMIKEVPDNLIKGIKTLSKDQNNEYSIDIDFERSLETPEQMLVMKGGERTTVRVGDFELFGHTHPHSYNPHPSNADLYGMMPFKPEFIVAQKTGKTIILSIEDYDKFQEWRNKINIHDPKTSQVGRNIDSKWGRSAFFNATGIKVYPMVKNLKIEMIDDPRREKKFPRAGQAQVIQWHTQEK